MLIGGVRGTPPVDGYLDRFDQEYKPILQALGGKCVDVMDFHWFGATTGDYAGARYVYDHIRSVLNASGFPADLPIWITETGAYSGSPVDPDYPSQTERQQALDYVKRCVYPLSFGVNKVFPAFGLMEGLMHDDTYFDHAGLIYDGMDGGDAGLGIRKLGYYAYKKMTEVLEGSDWSSIETILESGDVRVYKFTKDNSPISVAWWDYFNDASYTSEKTIDVLLTELTGTTALVTESIPKFDTGADVTDYSTAFTANTLSISGHSLTLKPGENPVYVQVAH